MAIYFGNQGNYPYYSYQPNTMTYPYTGQINNTAVPTSPSNIIVGIQGIDAAKAYPLAANTRAYMFDMEKDYIYIKETDANGMQKGPLQILECKQVSEESIQNKVTENTPTLPNNLVTTDRIDEYIKAYLDNNNYRSWIPKSERVNKNAE